MPRKEVIQPPATAQAQQDAVSDGIENYELPKSLVTRIAKSAIPENSKLQREMVLALVQGSTVFINYLAATAHDIATSRQHKSVSASDVLKALENLQFADMVDKIQEELKVYRELQKSGKKSGRGGESSTARSKDKGKGRATGHDQPEQMLTDENVGGTTVDLDGDQEMLDQDRTPGEDGDTIDDDAEEDELVDEEDEADETEPDDMVGESAGANHERGESKPANKSEVGLDGKH